MCGIVGYVGTRQAQSICLEGLRRLEYRGYDSAGITVINDEGLIDIRKVVGKLDKLQESLEEKALLGSIGIGHTRWATHGKPSEENGHPHLSCDGRIAIVHNGIIENYQELREELIDEGHVFQSQTDSEVMAHLVEKYYQGDLRIAVRDAVRLLRGAFAFGVICADQPDELVAVRCRSPLVVGIGEGENYIASDMPAIRPEIDKVYVIDDDQIALVKADSIELTDLDLNPVHKDIYEIPWPADAAGKGEHRHFMHKEIHEQSHAMYACLAGRLTSPDEPIRLDGFSLSDDEIRGLRKVTFTACGTAYHACMVGRFLIEKLAKIPADAELASEMRARDPQVFDSTLVVPISQSGETMDTLLALRDLRQKGAKVIAVVNTVDSTITRESDGVVYIQAGPEMGVASTKAYTLQLLTVELIALHMAEVRQTASPELIRSLKVALLKLPEQAEELIKRECGIQEIAKKYFNQRYNIWAQHGINIDNADTFVAEEGYWSNSRRRDAIRPNALFIGRGINLASAMEGALKLKEISYIHAEGYSAGEMKHGPIALVEPSLFTVAIATGGNVREQMISNIMEIKARSGPVIVVATDGDDQIETAGVDALADPSDYAGQPNDMIWIPECPELVSPVLVAIPLQMLAYHIADLRGEHIDQPRNLAKTVTVE